MVEIKYKDDISLEKLINILKKVEEDLKNIETRYLFAYEFAKGEANKKRELENYFTVSDHKEELQELLEVIEPKLKDLEQKEGQDLIFYTHLKHK